jgi:DNA polymerase-4
VIAMTKQRHIVHVHFHLPPDAEPGLFEQLIDLAEGITPRVQALPPDAADLDVTGALTYFDRDTHGLTQILRLRALALHGVPITAGSADNACWPRWPQQAPRRARSPMSATTLPPSTPSCARG